jgi:hypothetical protein
MIDQSAFPVVTAVALNVRYPNAALCGHIMQSIIAAIKHTIDTAEDTAEDTATVSVVLHLFGARG